jgi:glycylpeptide N-tetradecanoyltransferase
MQPKDVDSVLELLKAYLARFDMAPVFTKEEVEHWLLHDKDLAERVIWSYVIEVSVAGHSIWRRINIQQDPITKKVTDYFSFYGLESTVIKNTKHSKVRAAYLFYYASEVALEQPNDKPALKVRLNALINDALILAKKFKFDVFNSLSLMDNALFIEQQKFGKGDGQLHYYLYNYNANHIAGGVDKRNEIDEGTCSGIGVVML